MIISRTPYRISFFGGGTDYPAWYEKHGGAVLATTIDKYCHITCRYLPPFFEHTFRVVWSKIERCESLDEITHPSVRETLRYLNVTRGVEIHHDGDLPARSGIGSSSSFTVGLLNSLYALKGQMSSKEQLVADSMCIEQNVLKETVGSQDQISASYGGFNHIVFLPGGRYLVRPVSVRPERLLELNSHLMLFFTGISRTASDVAASYVANIESNERLLQLMEHMVDEGIAILSGSESIERFGLLLDEAWKAKRDLSSSVSSPSIDELYSEAIDAGALGGKLTGAGGGGFLLLFVPLHRQRAVRERLKDLVHVPFKFESSGSRILFYDVEENYADEDVVRGERMKRLAHTTTAGAERLCGQRRNAREELA